MFSEEKIRQVYGELTEEVQNALRLSDILFKDRLTNEYYRHKSFSHAPFKIRSVASEKQFTKLGLYFSGESQINVLERLIPGNNNMRNTRSLTCYYLNCAFCSFEEHFTCQDLVSEPKFEAALHRVLHYHVYHASHNVTCAQKRGNKPLRDQLTPYKLFNAYPTHLYPMRELEPISNKNKLTRVEVEASDTVRVVCQFCQERVIDTVLFPCGCIFMCGVCASKYTNENCINCDTPIVGYGRAILL